MSSIHEHVKAIEHHASAIADLVVEQPDAALFTTNVDAIPALERAWNLKPGIDAALAYAADKARAGDRVGSSRTVDYLTKELGLSYNEAMNRLRLGQQNHGKIIRPAPAPTPEPEPAPIPADDKLTQQERDAQAAERQRAEEQRRRQEEDQRRAAEERRHREEAAREQARKQARKSRLSQEKLNIINRELDKLTDDTCRNDIFARAVEQASKRLPEDLRDWVRGRVNDANRANRDPYAAWKKRELTVTRPDSDGGARVFGYLTPDTLALFEAAVAPGLRASQLLDDPTEEDTRTVPQRRHDALAVILKNHSAERVARTGVGTVVVSMSAKDIDNLDNADADHRFPTNTNAMLTPAEVLRLGFAKYNFVVAHDPNTGNPLHVARTKRMATIEQRMALLAAHLVCTNPDCTQPFCNCDIHHIKPWQYGGTTDIWNLAAICVRHHSENRDQRDGKNARGHVAWDPDTGRVGYQPPPRPGNPHPAVQVNNTERQEHSGGAKIRRQPWPGETSATPPGEAALIPPGRGEHACPETSDTPARRLPDDQQSPPQPTGPPLPNEPPGQRTHFDDPAATPSTGRDPTTKNQPPEQPPLFSFDDTG